MSGRRVIFRFGCGLVLSRQKAPFPPSAPTSDQAPQLVVIAAASR
jgi:hypothetical protein